MGYVQGTCPKCGAQVMEKCNAWVYGSPIRTCPKCENEFLDIRWREVAIDGLAAGCTIMFLRIITGCEDKQNAKYMAESRKRLQNKEYIDKLISFGYMVPDEFKY